MRKTCQAIRPTLFPPFVTAFWFPHIALLSIHCIHLSHLLISLNPFPPPDVEDS